MMDEGSTAAQLETAIGIAVRAHAGQVDQQGAPYILHPLRVMFGCTTRAAQIVAVLHDVLEDTDTEIDWTAFSPEIAAALDGVTRRQGESYEEFIERLAEDPIAVQVKIADVRDNLGRIEGLDVQTRAKLEPRYRAALARLVPQPDLDGA
jgi:(p)ppGpp synthase/HD superfamily hydrolase